MNLMTLLVETQFGFSHMQVEQLVQALLLLVPVLVSVRLVKGCRSYCPSAGSI